jgi:hypothetical protein
MDSASQPAALPAAPAVTVDAAPTGDAHVPTAVALTRTVGESDGSTHIDDDEELPQEARQPGRYDWLRPSL